MGVIDRGEGGTSKPLPEEVSGTFPATWVLDERQREGAGTSDGGISSSLTSFSSCFDTFVVKEISVLLVFVVDPLVRTLLWGLELK